MTKRIFVYGALRRGASNHWRMEGAKFLGETILQGTLVKIDWYPGLVLDGKSAVRGEVYEVEDLLLAALDEFEGISQQEDARNGEYERVTTEVRVEGEIIEVFVYEWRKGAADYEVVTSGDWLTLPEAR